MSEKIPKGWKWVKLGEAPLKIIDGDRGKNYPSNNDLKNNGYCLFLSTKNVKSDGFCFDECQFITKEKDEALKKGKLKRFDLVFTTRGTVGNVGYFNSKVKYENIRINSGMVIIRPDTRSLNPEFNYYIFRFIGKCINSFVSGSAQPQLPIRDLKEVKIPLPPLPEQKAIAEVLSSIDDKIELLHRQNTTLEEMAMTLFRQWFIEPTKDGLPEGWEEKALDEIAEFLNGIPSQKYPGDKLPVIKIKEMREGITESSDYCNNNVPEKYLVNSGDILFSWSGSLEVVIWFGSIGVLNQHIFKVTSLEYPKWFCYLSIKQHIEEFRAIAESKTTTMGHIQREHLSNTKVFIPPKIFFENFNKAMTPIFDKIIANNAEIQTLEKLRDTLLPKLMSGEVRVMKK